MENPYPYYARTDVYVHATRFEGKSLALQEALALGCAAIVSDCNGNREEITDGQDGLLCPFDPAALADRVKRLLEDEETRKELGRRAGSRKAESGCRRDSWEELWEQKG